MMPVSTPSDRRHTGGSRILVVAAGFMSGEIRLRDLADEDPANTSWVLPGHAPPAAR